MATTLDLATDEILKQFTETWNAGSAPLLGGSPLTPAAIEYVDFTNWTGRPLPPNNKNDRAWCRIMIAHVSGAQRTLRTEGELFENLGTVTVQIFTPSKDNAAPSLAQKLATVAKRAFMGKRTPNVWFSNPRYQEVGREGVWYQLNVTTDFQWDERR